MILTQDFGGSILLYFLSRLPMYVPTGIYLSKFNNGKTRTTTPF